MIWRKHINSFNSEDTQTNDAVKMLEQGDLNPPEFIPKGG